MDVVFASAMRPRFAKTMLPGAEPEPPTATPSNDDLARLREALAGSSTPLAASFRSLLNSTSIRNIEDARLRVAQWFDDGMQRASGWYKRQSQWIIAAVALFVCVAFNVDSIAIANQLMSDAAVRGRLVELAGNAVRSGASSDAGVQGVLSAVQKGQALGLPIGWPAGDANILARLAGWLISTVAAWIGAPFWFQLLTRLVNLRSSGPKPSDNRIEETS